MDQNQISIATSLSAVSSCEVGCAAALAVVDRAGLNF
jgi:hypothetical protein